MGRVCIGKVPFPPVLASGRALLPARELVTGAVLAVGAAAAGGGCWTTPCVREPWGPGPVVVGLATPRPLAPPVEGGTVPLLIVRLVG